jgi:16S rRNA (guanine966-N2)-methyltransferase
VTGGALRGRKLRTVPGQSVRPSSDRVREAVFQILAARLPGARVADLFAGTGALGIEALSRGAASCLFVERERRVAAVIERNLRELELSTVGRVVVGSVEDRLPLIGRAQPEGFDLILLDPPYRYAGAPALLARLADLLAAGGRLIWEHHRGAVELPPALAVTDERSYGQTVITQLARS